ncbi:ImmA/IrrE family metallo-endopeptidase [Enterococcus casseliflavus]|uniref:ImmA/IrrE family metallo-endopeptidase n=1 Tax=Enterococcus casseliflavus TaxID=37734 RepID=UPI00232D73B0|nr:ImmA/IrrE family metallo-endopeptidase [Enterococcus casseliflavus]MDB1690080.1 ImmA/IrrE family metallo-endopeptidase [Enterococcus casseliflavus]
MYNHETYEYREIDYLDYNLYSTHAYDLLNSISDWAQTPISEITYLTIIDYFSNKFDIEVVYFDNKPCPINSKHDFIHPEVIEVTKAFSKRVSGFTVSSASGSRFKLFLRKYNSKQRMIFTLLHELVHIYFHCSDRDYMQIFASVDVDGFYPDEILPFEDEANVIASILYLNNEKLIEYLDEGLSFDRILVKHCISRKALHNRINNYLIYDVGLNPKVAFFNYLLPYKDEVYGNDGITHLQSLMAMSKNNYR